MREDITADHPKTFLEAWDVAGAPRLRWRRELDVDDWPAPSAVSPDGSVVAVIEIDVALLDARTGKPRHVLREDGTFALAFSADGSQLAVTSNEGPNHLWRVRDGKDLGVLPASTDYVALGIAFSRSGRYLALTEPRQREPLVKRGQGYPRELASRRSRDMEPWRQPETTRPSRSGDLVL